MLAGWVCAASAAAQPAPPPCGEEDLAAPPRVSIAGGRISLLPPPGLQVHPPAMTPRHELLLLNAYDATFVSVWRSDWGADPAAAERLGEFIELHAPEIQWIVRDTLEVGGTRWFRFHYTRRLLGEHLIYEQHYATTFQGRGVHVAATVPAHNEERIAQLQRIASTLQVRDCALPAGTEAAPPAVQAGAGTCRPGQVRSYPDAAEPRRVETAGGLISLVPPEGFRARSIPPRPGAPTRTVLAFSNDAGAMIGVMEGSALPPVDSVADIMAGAMARSIDEVLGSDVVEQGGTRWGRLEFTGRQNGNQVHSVHYMAPFQGKGVVVTFTSPIGDADVQAQLARSAATLEMADCTLVPSTASAPEE